MAGKILFTISTLPVAPIFLKYRHPIRGLKHLRKIFAASIRVIAYGNTVCLFPFSRRIATGCEFVGSIDGTVESGPRATTATPVPYLPLVPGYDVMHWRVADMMSCTGRWRYDVMHWTGDQYDVMHWWSQMMSCHHDVKWQTCETRFHF